MWSQFLASPEARGAVIIAILPFIVGFIKPYLPTGRKDADAKAEETGTAQPIENRWTPLVTVGLGGVLGLLGALQVNYGTNLPKQDILYSLAVGIGAGGFVAGGYRTIKLSMNGDVAAKAATKYAQELRERGVDPDRIA
jgi:hypothetical protein